MSKASSSASFRAEWWSIYMALSSSFSAYSSALLPIMRNSSLSA